MKQQRLLAVWLDGFRTDYLSEHTTPFLFELSQNALIGEYQPSLAFTGIGVSIFTGTGASKHGIWTEFCYAPTKSLFKWTVRTNTANRFLDWITDHTGCVGQLGRATINLSIFKASNILFDRTYMPMALEAPTSSLHFFSIVPLYRELSEEKVFIVPSLFDVLREKDILFRVLEESKMRDSQIFKEAMRIDQNARLVFIQLGELDIVGHEKGPNSKEIHRSLRTIDTRVQRIVEEQRKNFETDVFIFSDHGMVEVKKTVNILSQLRKSGLREGRDFITFLDSTLARFWTLRPEAKQEILKALKTINGGRILSDDDLKRYQIPTDRKYGEIIWLADPGTLILPNYYQGSKMVHGMHGYAPETEGLRSPFIIHSKDIKPRRVKHIATPMDIFATLAALLNVYVPSWPIDGKPLTSCQ